MAISRRSALKLGAGAIAVSALSGCNAEGGPQTASGSKGSGKLLGKHQVVVIGGGFGGLTVAKQLKKIDKNFDVLIIEKNDSFMACPFSNTNLGKLKNINLGTFVFDYAQAVENNDYGMLKTEVLDIDRKNKRVSTVMGDIEYEILIMSPGISYDYETQFPNWDSKKIKRAHRAAPGALIPGGEHVALARMLDDLEDGNVVITVPSGKFRCPPAPFERASMIAAYIKKEGLSSKVIVLNPGAKFAKFGAFMETWKDLYKDIIEYVPHAKVQDADFDKKTVSYTVTTPSADLDKDDVVKHHKINYAVLNLIPYNKANPVVTMSGVETTKDSFGKVKMNGCSFRTKTDASIYAIGDVVGHGLPPSGQTANWEGNQCAIEVAHVLHNKPYELPVKTSKQKAGNVCFSMVADKPEEGIRVIHDFSWTGTVIKGKGHVPKDTKTGKFRSKRTARAAHEWYRGIMNDLFG